MIRFGLCCLFYREPVKFRTATATAVLKLSKKERLKRLSALCLENADSLHRALRYCADNGIGCFRVTSQFWPLKTHPEAGYALTDLPDFERISETLKKCGRFAGENDIRTTFHPDQFIVLNSPRLHIVKNAVGELDYQAEVAELIGADVINVHAGGAYGDKISALETLRKNLSLLPERVRARLTFENDDRIFTPEDILPLCRSEKLPFVYDIHHHRCHGDGLTPETATEMALATWDREPLFHISSPLAGWSGPWPHRHHDFINIRDFPKFWEKLDITVEIEAKAKEVAIKKLQESLKKRRQRAGR